MKKALKKAFTIVELLVVIAIIAVLTVAGVVAYSAFTKKAELSNDISAVTQFDTLLQGYEALEGKPSTFSEAVDRLKQEGIDLDKYKLASENHKLQMITKEQILEYLHAALKRTSKQLISFFVRKIVLFNDHIDIYCKSVENNDPDGNDSHRAFSFYEMKMTVEVDRHTFGGETEKQTYAVTLWI